MATTRSRTGATRSRTPRAKAGATAKAKGTAGTTDQDVAAPVPSPETAQDAAAPPPSPEAVAEETAPPPRLEPAQADATTTPSPQIEPLADAVESMTAEAAKQVEKVNRTMMTNYDDLVGYMKANAEAATAAYTILYKGMDSFNLALFSFYRTMHEMNLAAMKEVLAAKSFTEVVDLQNNHAKAIVDSFVAETTKLSDMGVMVANEALEPINERMTVTVAQLSKTAAA